MVDSDSLWTGRLCVDWCVFDGPYLGGKWSIIHETWQADSSRRELCSRGTHVSGDDLIVEIMAVEYRAC